MKTKSNILAAMLMGALAVSGIALALDKAPAGAIDLNAASEKQLEDLPGVGKATAKKIVAGRPYKSVEDLSKAGVPAKTVEKIKPLVSVGPTTSAAPRATSPSMPANARSAPGTTARPPAPITSTTAPEPSIPAPTAPAARAAPSMPSAPAPAANAPTTPEPSIPAPTAPAARAAPSMPSAPAPAANAPTSSRGAGSMTGKLAPGEKVNINSATPEQLDALPGIGPVKAKAIIEARPFAAPEDIMKVKGIKQGEFAKIKGLITVK